MTKRNYLPLLLIGIIVFVSCKKSAVSPTHPIVPPKNDTDVYVVGTTNATNGYSVATYWKNGLAVKLGDSTENSLGLGIAISGNDIYVVGYEIDANYNTTALCWKNGIKINLTNSANSVARSIIVSGGNTYVAGNILGSSKVALYWMNNIPFTIDADPNQNVSEYIATNGSDIYTAGWSVLSDNTTEVASYWKNGTRVQLTSGYSEAYGIAINGNDMYVVGAVFDDNRLNYQPVYWKNNTEVSLAAFSNANASSRAKSIAIDNNIVYVGGQTTSGGKTVAAYWKNGTIYTESDIVSTVNAIAVGNGNVYLAGSQNNNPQPVYWKNGTAYPLAKNGEAYGIAIVPH